ncbi:hypothetical protein LCGC14_3093070 [marine sediment metagenome]|uniref:Uncharacterized protein n=1 Tax=marine sediment metagenome TaxID=412755 RepID=A0A0F8YHD6_9ZZZZ
MDLPLLIAVHVPEGLIWGGIPTLLASAGGGIRLLWGYWTKQQEKKDEATKAQIDAFQNEITRLQKELSKKSDAHAAKVEELLKLAMGKVEEWGERSRVQHGEFVQIAADFTALAKKFGLEET